MCHALFKAKAVLVAVILIMTDPCGCVIASAQVISPEKAGEDTLAPSSLSTHPDTVSFGNNSKGALSTVKDTSAPDSNSFRTNKSDCIPSEDRVIPNKEGKHETLKAIAGAVLVLGLIVVFYSMDSLAHGLGGLN